MSNGGGTESSTSSTVAFGKRSRTASACAAAPIAPAEVPAITISVGVPEMPSARMAWRTSTPRKCRVPPLGPSVALLLPTQTSEVPGSPKQI